MQEDDGMGTEEDGGGVPGWVKVRSQRAVNASRKEQRRGRTMERGNRANTSDANRRIYNHIKIKRRVIVEKNIDRTLQATNNQQQYYTLNLLSKYIEIRLSPHLSFFLIVINV